MSIIPAGANFSPAEKAYFESAGAVHPETGKPAAEESKDGTDTTGRANDGNRLAEGDGKPAPEAKQVGDDAESDKRTDGADGDADESDEVVEVADGTNPDGTVRRKMIAFGAYDRQRKAANALKETTAKMAQQMAYLTGALEQMRTGKAPTADTTQTPQITATPPDYKTKPQEWLDWVNQTVAHAATFTQQQGQQTEVQRQMSDLNNAVVAAEQEFMATAPDFMEAVMFVRARHTAELKEAGYEAAEIQQILSARAQDLAIRALRAGKNPAERLYAVAKQHGYKKVAAKDPAPAESEAAKIARQADGQAKATTISKLAGGAEKGLSMEVLANTPMAEFQKLFKEGKPHELMGIPKE